MNYQVEHHSGRTVFVFYTNKITFEEFTALIDTIIQPDKKFTIETTSWTQAFSFKKDDLEIYFEHFYDSNAYFSFELLPRSKYSEVELSKLEDLVTSISRLINEN
nr:hypothetical protein [uncultured Flavobacterium sp.]